MGQSRQLCVIGGRLSRSVDFLVYVKDVRHLLNLRETSAEQVRSWIQRAESFRKNPYQKKLSGSVAVLMFEPSTRTKLSFAQAAFQLNLQVLDLGANESSSLVKGETIEDTVLNVQAMGPQAVILRCGDEVDVQALSSQMKVPLISAGWGKRGHPTQALLDVFTLWGEHKDFWFRRVLFVGDMKHSRVAASHIELLQTLGVEMGSWAPPSLQTENSAIRRFSSADEAFSWADVVMGLRTQTERHKGADFSPALLAQYSLRKEDLPRIKKDAVILHPGPVNWGAEFAPEVKMDSRNRILKQVTCGVFMRQALLEDRCSQ